jgi:hypothetical protein
MTSTGLFATKMIFWPKMFSFLLWKKVKHSALHRIVYQDHKVVRCFLYTFFALLLFFKLLCLFQMWKDSTLKLTFFICRRHFGNSRHWSLHNEHVLKFQLHSSKSRYSYKSSLDLKQFLFNIFKVQFPKIFQCFLNCFQKYIG